MIWKSIVTRGACVALACGMLSAALAQDDELDVTMRVLDDISEIEGVILSIGAERTQTQDELQAADSRSAAATDAEESALPDLSSRDLDVVAEVDRDEDAETALEDFDIPEDLDL